MKAFQTHIIYPASKASNHTPKAAILELEKAGFPAQEQLAKEAAAWDFYAGPAEERASIFQASLTDPTCNAIWAGRGGYGVCDILPLIRWHELEHAQEKPIIGFSDVSALQSALYAVMRWRSIHGPMPNTEYWQASDAADYHSVFKSLQEPKHETSIPLDQHWGAPYSIGPLFGGCLSVLTGLIGTRFFPKSLQDHILFWEDIGEHPAKVLRYLQQWILSGSLKGVRHIVIGNFAGLAEFGYLKEDLSEEIHKRTGISVSSTDLFGHCTPNYPIGIGCSGRVGKDALTWTWSQNEAQS